MSYRGQEKRRAIDMRESLFKDSGNGLFSRKKRKFVLKDPTLNLLNY